MSIDGNLFRRVAIAVVAIPLALALVWDGGGLLGLGGGVAGGGVLGARALFDLAARQEIRAIRIFGLLSAAALAPLTYGALVSPRVHAIVLSAWPYGAAVWMIGLLTLVLARRSPSEKPLSSAAVTLLAVAYTSALPAFLIAIRHHRFPERSW